MAGDIRRRLRRLEEQFRNIRMDLSQLSDEELERLAAPLTAEAQAALGINFSSMSDADLLKIATADVDDDELLRLLRAASNNSETQAADPVKGATF